MCPLLRVFPYDIVTEKGDTEPLRIAASVAFCLPAVFRFERRLPDERLFFWIQTSSRGGRARRVGE